MNQVQLDEKRVEALIMEIGQALRRHLSQVPPERQQVYEALNALMIHAALIIHGSAPEAQDFFLKGLDAQLKALGSARAHSGPN